MTSALDGEEIDDKEVEELEVMMRKMVAIKGVLRSLSRCILILILTTTTEMGESMDEAQRKRFAAKAVNDLLKDL